MGEAQDIITLRGLSAVGKHGVFEFERSGSQVFTADITLWVDAQRAAETDNVELTVDYGKIADGAVAVLTGPPVYLIETLAHRLVQMALQDPLVEKAKVTVHKPMAPVAHLFDDVSVTLVRSRSQITKAIPEREISSQAPPQLAQSVAGPPAPPTKGSKRLVLALGSNQGDSVRILSAAVGALIEAPGIEVDEVSPLVVTAPVLKPGQAPQPNYYNAVVLARTVLEPKRVLELTQSIETQFGRLRNEEWGPRTLDVDIVDLGGEDLDTPTLVLPHPRAAERAFVLYPWSLADPKAQLRGESVAKLAKSAPDFAGMKSATENWLLEEPPVLPEPPTQTETARDAVVIRGSNLSLTDVEGDAIFRRLLQKERTPAAPAATQRELKTVLPESPEPPRAPGPIPSFPKRRAAAASQVQSVLPPTISPAREQRPTPAPAAHISSPSISPAGKHTANAPSVDTSPTPVSSTPPALPHRRRPVQGDEGTETDLGVQHEAVGALPDLPNWRFLQGHQDVRIVDSVDSVEEDPEATAQSRPRWGRRRVVRPTPTGMISLGGPAADSSADGGA